MVVPVYRLQVTLGRHYLTSATEDRLRNETRQLPVLAPNVLDDALHVFGVPFACERKSVSKSWICGVVVLTTHLRVAQASELVHGMGRASWLVITNVHSGNINNERAEW